MVMPVPPRTVSCKKCGWKKNIPETSDCLHEGSTGFSACPECGSEKVDVMYKAHGGKLFTALSGFFAKKHG